MELIKISVVIVAKQYFLYCICIIVSCCSFSGRIGARLSSYTLPSYSYLVHSFIFILDVDFDIDIDIVIGYGWFQPFSLEAGAMMR